MDPVLALNIQKTLGGWSLTSLIFDRLSHPLFKGFLPGAMG
jgi:serine protease inhibitor ecotin